MRRLARFVMYAGTAVLVLGLSDFHATYIGHYSPTGTGRLVWALAYIAFLCVAAYAVGLPDLPKNAYNALGLAVAANLAASLCISLAELALGVAILPRFVVFWTASLLVPGYALCAFVAAQGRRDQRRRDRVLAVLTPEETAAFVSDVARSERRVSVARVLPHEQATTTETGGQLLMEAFVEVDASIIVLDRVAQNDESIVTQAAQLHGRGVRIRTLSLFYDEWLGKLPLSELERVSLMFDIGELHRLRYGRLKRLFDVSHRPARPGASGRRDTAHLAGRPMPSPTEDRCSTGRTGVGQGGQASSRSSSSARCGPTRATGEWTEDHDDRITPVGRWLRKHPPRRAAAGHQHPARRPRGGRAPPRAAPATSTTSPRSSRSTTCATWSVPASPAGPR